MERSAEDLSQLIREADAGENRAMDALFALAYEELRRLARSRLRASGGDPILDTTSLVHESYLKLVGTRKLSLHDRAHLIRYASRAMRSVIVDNVRERQTARRGSEAEHVPFTTRMGEALVASEENVLRVHEALEEVAVLDPRLARVVEMRYFAGMTERDIATALGLTDRTVRRDWEKARALLSRVLR